MFTDELLLKVREVATLPRPSDQDYRSVVDLFASHKPLVDEEADYMKRKEDIVIYEL